MNIDETIEIIKELQTETNITFESIEEVDVEIKETTIKGYEFRFNLYLDIDWDNWDIDIDYTTLKLPKTKIVEINEEDSKKISILFRVIDPSLQNNVNLNLLHFIIQTVEKRLTLVLYGEYLKETYPNEANKIIGLLDMVYRVYLFLIWI